MKKNLIGVFACFAVCAAGAETNPLHFTAEQRQAAGIVLAAPTTTELRPEVEAFGRVIDPGPFVAATADVASARADLAASDKELARVRSLFENGENAAAQSVEAAEAAEAKDRVQLESARAKLIAGWGPALAKVADVGLTSDALEKGWALARIDVPPGEALGAVSGKVRVGLLTGGSGTFEADILEPAPTVDPQIQGGGYLIVLNDHWAPIGAALIAWLPAAGPAGNTLVVPESAVVYHEGSAFVYVLGKKDVFERRLVELGRVVGDGYAVSAGVEAGDSLVVVGAQQLLSTELQAAAGPSGDTD